MQLLPLPEAGGRRTGLKSHLPQGHRVLHIHAFLQPTSRNYMGRSKDLMIALISAWIPLLLLGSSGTPV